MRIPSFPKRFGSLEICELFKTILPCFIARWLSTMAAIGLDILNIGSSKWSQDMEMSLDMMAAEGAPSHFMLPAVGNVSQYFQALVLAHWYMLTNLTLTCFYSLLSFAGQILTPKRERIMTRKLSSWKEQQLWASEWVHTKKLLLIFSIKLTLYWIIFLVSRGRHCVGG